jgi:hypothetical protein
LFSLCAGIGGNWLRSVDMAEVCSGFHEQHHQLAQSFGVEACRRKKSEGTYTKEEEEEGANGNTINRIVPGVDSHSLIDCNHHEEDICGVPQP